MAEHLLRVDEVTAGYGRVQVLNGISIELEPGGNVGLFGPNGHGKTTLLRAISGLVRPTSGRIEILGRETTAASADSIVELGLIHVPQGNTLFPDLTIAETLELGAHRRQAREVRDRSRELAVEIFPKLGERWKQRVSTLSGGERQMVSIAMALMNCPKILILDEPTLGLSPKMKEELCATIHGISDRGIPLLVVEQDVDFLLTLARRLYFVSHGETKMEIAADQRLSNEDIMEMYFGS